MAIRARISSIAPGSQSKSQSITSFVKTLPCFTRGQRVEHHLQSVTWSLPAADDVLPSHGRQLSLLCAAYVCGGQVGHHTLPDVCAAFPGGHVTHSPEPSELLYFPTAHASQPPRTSTLQRERTLPAPGATIMTYL